MITQAELLRILKYDPISGNFTWLVYLSGANYPGQIAGCLNNKGYVRIGIRGKSYLAHRLAFLYMTGKIPAKVDHKDTVKNNNAWGNLRGATSSQNTCNSNLSSRNTSGIKGVTWSDGVWEARINLNGVRYYLGRFNSVEEAAEVVKAHRNKLHGDFSR